jgi:hypothetical protein
MRWQRKKKKIIFTEFFLPEKKHFQTKNLEKKKTK